MRFNFEEAAKEGGAPGGSPMPNRSFQSADGYKYGFNGMEKDNEIKGNGNCYDFGARIYDPRIMRWMSTDAMESSYSSFSPYNFVLNNPIRLIDPDGNEVEDNLVVDRRSDTYIHVTGSITINLVVVNTTGKSLNIDTDALEKSVSSQFSGSIMAGTNFVFDENGNRTEGGKYTTISGKIKVNLNITQVTDNLDKIEDPKNHVMLLVNEIPDGLEEFPVGLAQLGGEIGAVEAKTLGDGSFKEVFLHELGHNLNMGHTSTNEDLMGERVNESLYVSPASRGEIVMGALFNRFANEYLSKEGMNQIEDSNNIEEAKKFIKDEKIE